MMPSRHAAISVGLGLILWWATSSFVSLVLSVIGGFFIDLDHLVEYFRFRLAGKEDKLFIVFHSIELLIPLWILASILGMQIQALALTIGFIAHLLSDAYGNATSLKVFSLTYRIAKGFDYRALMGGREPDFKWARRGPRYWW